MRRASTSCSRASRRRWIENGAWRPKPPTSCARRSRSRGQRSRRSRRRAPRTRGRRAGLGAIDCLSALVEALLWFAKAQARLDGAGDGGGEPGRLVRGEIAARRKAGDCAPVRTLPDEALVRGDERLLGRVAANLLDNALKYGRALTDRDSRRAQGAARLEMTIAMRAASPRTSAARLFEPFYGGNGAKPQVPAALASGSPSPARPRRGRTAEISPSADSVPEHDGVRADVAARSAGARNRAPDGG